MAGVYLGEASEGLVFAGSATGRLWAIRVSSGAVRWSRLVVADGRTTVFAPIVSGRVVAAGFTSFGVRPSGGVAAVDASTGRVRWKAWFPDAASPGGGTAFAGGPVAVDALVLAASQDGAVHAFDGRTGARQWSIAATAPSASGAFEYRALARAGSSVVAASLTGLVTAYDLHTRLVRWRRRVLSASVMFGLATDERAVYVPYLSGDLVALDADDGDPRWRTTPDASGFSWKPLVAAGRVFAASTSAGFFAFHP
jgi:outer membrane protein assembly factor BamB